MAVENQTPQAPPVASPPTMSTDFVRVISAAAALAAVIIAGMALVMSLTAAPIREDMRLMHEDIRLLRTDMQRGFEDADAENKALRQDMNSEFKAIREEIKTLSERLTRLETLFEQITGPTNDPEESATEAE